MGAGAKTRTQGKKYQVKNWSEYNESLVCRGDVTLWLEEDLILDWEHENTEKKLGSPFICSDQAIRCLLLLREVFKLTYRQTEGFGRSLVKLMAIQIRIPDYTSLQKRAAKLQVALNFQPVAGARDIAIDPKTGEIVAEELTQNDKHDGDQVDALLEQVDNHIERFFGDGAYDQRKVYDALEYEAADPAIPPRENARLWQHGNSKQPRHSRDEVIRAIRKTSRRAWKIKADYHLRSLVETTLHRLKSICGARLKNRKLCS